MTALLLTYGADPDRRGFDLGQLLLRRDGQSQLVYKHAISTIMPAQPINLYDGEDNS